MSVLTKPFWAVAIDWFTELGVVNAFTALYCRISRSNAAAIAMRARNIRVARVAA